MLQDLDERAKKYILHGLGEAKLMIEHYKAEIEANPGSENNKPMVELVERVGNWINSQRREFLVEVNLGHWAQLDYRTMAQESGNESLYKFAYRPFTQAAHNMWPHVSVYNLRHCNNALHRHHLIPELFQAPHDVDFMFRCCKCIHRTYELFVDRFGLQIDSPMPLDWWNAYFSKDDPDSASDDDQKEGHCMV